MNIFKTFETFLKEPISILKNNVFRIVSLQTDNLFSHKPSFDVSVTKDFTQLTVVNNEKMYKLLSLVTYKAQQKKEKEIIKK